jgi:Gpi18-like mannosyltransferase
MKIFAIISTLIFISALIGFYFLEKSKHGTGGKAKPHTIWCLLAFGFIVRVVLAMSIEGFSSDVGLFRYWSERAAEDLFHIYQGDFFIDYPPFYIYILFIIGKISGFFGIGRRAFKFTFVKNSRPSLRILEQPSCFIILPKTDCPGKWPLLAASLYIFNPAVLINSSVWGQGGFFPGAASGSGIYYAGFQKARICRSALCCCCTNQTPGADIAACSII